MDEPFHLHVVDTPELGGVDKATKAKGIVARDALTERVLTQDVALRSIKNRKGKYGYCLGV